MKDIRRNIIKGYKPIVIKYLALLIAVCYLANPLQSQISSVFHEISHIFEIPESPIGHTKVTEKQIAAHHYHEHTHNEDQHEHTLIDLLDSIFNSSADSHEESVLVQVKFDKHINTYQYPVFKIFQIDKDPNFVSNENKLQKGHSNILEEPPQSYSFG